MTTIPPVRDTTSWSLIEGAVAGDPEGREEFARRYAPVIRSCLGSRWRGSPLAAEIDDAVQEVFVDCFRDGGALGRADPSRPGGFRAYLYGVTRVVALRIERERARQKERPAPDSGWMESLPSGEEDLERAFDRAWALSLMAEAASRQQAAARDHGPEAARRFELLRLRFQEGLPVRDIADRWGEDPERVHREYARAREEFREALLETVALHHPGDPGEIRREASRLIALL